MVTKSFGPQCPDVAGTNKVSNGFIAAFDAGEFVLGLPIRLVDDATARTGPAGVAWIDSNDRDAFKPRLVGYEPAKLVKGPPSKPSWEMALQAALQRSSVSRSDFACALVGLELEIRHPLHKFRYRMIWRLSASGPRLLPALKDAASGAEA